MSQQEFDPQFQAQEQDEVYYPRAPYSWSGKLDQEAVPRDEPPSNYGETRPGRDQSGSYALPQKNSSSFNSGGQQQGRSDGDAHTYQRGYGPYNSYNSQSSAGAPGQAPGTVPTGGQGQSVPPWARPQQHRRAPLRFGFIILVLVIIALIQGLIANGGLFVGAAGDIVGAVVGLLLLVLIVPLIILVVFSGLLLRMFRSGGPDNSGHRQRWRGRSWPNGPYWW